MSVIGTLAHGVTIATVPVADLQVTPYGDPAKHDTYRITSHSETFLAANGATVEVGTIEHNGVQFSATGGVVDIDGGYVLAYIADDIIYGPDHNGTRNVRKLCGNLTLWNGEVIGRWHTVSRRLCYVHNAYGHYTRHYVRARLTADTSRQWHGWYSEDSSQLVRLRPYKTA